MRKALAFAAECRAVRCAGVLLEVLGLTRPDPPLDPGARADVEKALKACGPALFGGGDWAELAARVEKTLRPLLGAEAADEVLAGFRTDPSKVIEAAAAGGCEYGASDLRAARELLKADVARPSLKAPLLSTLRPPTHRGRAFRWAPLKPEVWRNSSKNCRSRPRCACAFARTSARSSA